MPAEIRYLRREQIDTGKWDETVIKNDNGLRYHGGKLERNSC